MSNAVDAGIARRVSVRKAAMTQRVAEAIEHNGSLNIIALEGLIDADPLLITAALHRLQETGTIVAFKEERYDGRLYTAWRMA